MAIVYCFLMVHVTTLVTTMNTYPKLYFLSSTHPTQIESVYPHDVGSFLMLYKMSKSSVPFTYLNTLFATVQCSTFEVVMNLEMKLTT